VRISETAVEALKSWYSEWRVIGATGVLRIPEVDDPRQTGFERRVWLLERLLTAPLPRDAPAGARRMLHEAHLLLPALDAFANNAYQTTAERRAGVTLIAGVGTETVVGAVLLWGTRPSPAVARAMDGQLAQKLAAARDAKLLGQRWTLPDGTLHASSAAELACVQAYRLRNLLSHEMRPVDDLQVRTAIAFWFSLIDQSFEALARAVGGDVAEGTLPERRAASGAVRVAAAPGDFRPAPGEVAFAPCVDEEGLRVELARTGLLRVRPRDFASPDAMDARLSALPAVGPLLVVDWPAAQMEGPAKDRLERWARSNGIAVRVAVERPGSRVLGARAARAELSVGEASALADLGSVPGLDRAPFVLLVETDEPASVFEAMWGAAATSALVGVAGRLWLAVDSARLADPRASLADASADSDAAWVRAFPEASALGGLVAIERAGADLAVLARAIAASSHAWVVTSVTRAPLDALAARLDSPRVIFARHAGEGLDLGPAASAAALGPDPILAHLRRKQGPVPGALRALCLAALELAGRGMDELPFGPTLSVAYEADAAPDVDTLARHLAALAGRDGASSLVRDAFAGLGAETIAEITRFLATAMPSLAMTWAFEAARAGATSAALALVVGGPDPFGDAAAAGCLAALGSTSLGELANQPWLDPRASERLALAALRRARRAAPAERTGLLGLARRVGKRSGAGATIEALATLAEDDESLAFDEQRCRSAVEVAVRAGELGDGLVQRIVSPWGNDVGGGDLQPTSDDEAFWAALRCAPPSASRLMLHGEPSGLVHAAVGLAPFDARVDPETHRRMRGELPTFPFPCERSGGLPC
jgi:hypothetical protein